MAEAKQVSMENQRTIASLSGIPRFHTFKMRGGVQGHRVTVLVDGGASHNFINASLVEQKGITTEAFEGFFSDHTGGEHPKLHQVHSMDDIKPRELHDYR
jgi:hypothetical protein